MECTLCTKPWVVLHVHSTHTEPLSQSFQPLHRTGVNLMPLPPSPAGILFLLP
jgi:hypothetical protein